MPETKTEERTRRKFKEEYGDRSDNVYFALRNKNKKFDRSQGGGYSSKSEKAQWWADRLSRMSPAAKAKVLENIKIDGPLHWWVQRVLAMKDRL